MIDAIDRKLRRALRFSQDKCALENRLGVQRKTLGRPFGFDLVSLHGLRDVKRYGLRMRANTVLAGPAYRRVGIEYFLNQCTHQTRKFGYSPLQHGPSKIDIPQQPVERVGMLMVRGCFKDCCGCLRPMRCRSDGKFLLTFKVMEEAALGEASRQTDVIDGSARVTALAEHLQRCVE